ncbi:MAG: sugar phosphate isomerase/epimerase [Verrucomicrobia bacterium]|nr:sugar phosphate isomerase/epimerase [Verrucomicrobiota bacterium]
MKLGVFTVLFSDLSFEDMLDKVEEAGLDCIELGTGSYPGDAHCKPAALLDDERRLEAFQRAIAEHHLEISALACHGNPLHPDGKVAKAHDETFRKACELAGKLGVERVTAFSGCPGGSDGDTRPNWVTCPWPDDFSEIVKWQWEQKVIPYWKEAAAFAGKHKVTKICLEMHPGFVVYNPETLLKLRAAVGNVIGANFDPSHLFWQGIDPMRALRALKGAVYHVHAKDTKVYTANTEINGVLDLKHYAQALDRSWMFRTVGYGHDFDWWKDFVSTLRLIGYDDVLSIEHEDCLMSIDEGFSKAVEFLQQIMFAESPGEMWWA